ncbi:hypothetical protein [Paracidovorax anthurii]|uniref:Uncharacterized protein n=1 Tax=Paracidovorax anthurii TaxID=78229 RepID=A0A328ZIQ5_9BURK|nr:hypothetical protein [Paracidovorax anthurii]RAR86070.1 hypothetical protein AX018_100231 [Paracidovorax anthurii]
MMDNPFKAGIHAGVQTYYGTVEDRVNAVARFDRSQCEAALQVPALQKTVAAAVQRRIRWLDKVVTRIHFEDCGQDFLHWELDSKGKVIGCEPFQASVWCGKEVVQPGRLAVGDLVHFYESQGKTFRHIRYRVAKVERFSKNPS